jgi:sugar phosphate isomerase/epimerase
LVRQALRELLPEAAQRGVRLAVEPMHAGCASEWTFLTTLSDALRLMDEIDHPNLWLAFDTYHLGQEPCALARVAEIASRVAVVHLGDGHQAPSREQNRCLLGEGSVPLREILAALAAGGYDGDFDVVLMGEDIEECDYDALLERSKLAFGELVPN